MKKIYSLICVVIFANLFCIAQTVLPYEKYLIGQYNLNLSTQKYYSTIESLMDKAKANVYAFVCQSGDLTYNGQTIPANGTAAILIQFKTSTGEIAWSSSLGNQTVPINNIVSSTQDANGNICIVGRGDFQNGTSLVLGNQTFVFRSDIKPIMVVATLNTSTHLWSKVRFLYAPDQQGLTVNPLFDVNGNFYICGTVASSALYVDNILVESIGSLPGTNIFVYKEDPSGTFIYSKQSSLITTSSLDNILFALDNTENLFITGYISYVTGSMSMDGVVVKNDTLSNKYDYSYSDIFLYKISSTGTVKFGKTYLFSGNEDPLFLKALPNGMLYLCGEYNGVMNNFPTTSGELFYNRFYAKISGENGAFLWAYPLNSNVYYSDRSLYNALLDNDNNLVISANFCPNSINFMGQTFQKRNNTYGTSNTLVARISSDGVLQWGNVLGPVTTFTSSYVDNPRVMYAGLGSRLLLQVASLSYGTNTDFAWGSGSVPATTMPDGYGGNMAVIDNSGDVEYGYTQGYTKTFEIDSLHYFALRNNYLSWDVALFKAPPVTSISNLNYNNDLVIYPNPVSHVLTIKNTDALSNDVEIYNLEGKIVLKQLIVNNRISVDNLANGMYELKIGNQFARFIKNK